jgi:hypothetical protein
LQLALQALGIAFWRSVPVSVEGIIEGALAGGVDCVGLTVMHLIGVSSARCRHCDAADCTIEEAAPESLRMLDAAEALWKSSSIRLMPRKFCNPA